MRVTFYSASSPLKLGNYRLSLLCAAAIAFATVTAPTESLARDGGAIVGAIIGAAAGAIIANGMANAHPAYPPPRRRTARPRHRSAVAAQNSRQGSMERPKVVQAPSDPFAGEAPAQIRRAKD